MSFLRYVMLLVDKDLRIERRSGEIAITSGFFAVLITVLASLSFYLDDTTSLKVAPGVLWISVAFSGVLAMGRAWARERDEAAYLAVRLSALPRGALYIGKLVSTFLFLAVVEALLTAFVALLFHVPVLDHLGGLVAILSLGTFGFVAAGTLFFSMTVKTGSRDLLLSVVLFSLVSPSLLASVVATRELFGGATIPEVGAWLRILGAADLIFAAAGIGLLDLLLED